VTVASFLETLLSLSLQVAVVISVTAWIVRSSRAEPHADRLWMSCHIAILALTILGFGMPHLRLLPHSLITERIPLADLERVESEFASFVLFVWLSGITVLLFALVRGAVQTAIILRNATPISLDTGEAFDGLATIRVLSSRRIAGPFCWQIHQPVIVLPEFVLGLPKGELRMIVRHEFSHLRAGHPLHLFLQRIVEALFWFHPLVWWASYRATCCREFRCDKESIRHNDEASEYLRGLLRLAERGISPAAGLPAGLAFGGKQSLVRQRVARLTNQNWNASPTGCMSCWLPLSVFATACVAASLWIPTDATASDRSLWSPWPRWSANALQSLGISARDYEIDGPRMRQHEHRINR